MMNLCVSVQHDIVYVYDECARLLSVKKNFDHLLSFRDNLSAQYKLSVRDRSTSDCCFYEIDL